MNEFFQAWLTGTLLVVLWSVFSPLVHLWWQERRGRHGHVWWCAICFPTWAKRQFIEYSLNRLLRKLGVDQLNRIIDNSAAGETFYKAMRLCCPKCGFWFERVRVPWANLDGLPIGNWPCPNCNASVLDVNTSPSAGGSEEVIVKM